MPHGSLKSTFALDDVLIYSFGNFSDHWIKVNLVQNRLGLAGLKMDPRKSEFAVKQTKYLGFIICLGNGIKVDPEFQDVESSMSREFDKLMFGDVRRSRYRKGQDVKRSRCQKVKMDTNSIL